MFSFSSPCDRLARRKVRKYTNITFNGHPRRAEMKILLPRFVEQIQIEVI
jgi:hypothetical protein